MDLLVIVREPVNKAQEMVRLRRVLVDLLVCSVADVARFGTWSGVVLYSALREGKVLHDITY